MPPIPLRLSVTAVAIVVTVLAADPCRAAENGGAGAPPEIEKERKHRPVLAVDGGGGVTSSHFASDLLAARAQLSFPWRSFFLGGAFGLQDRYMISPGPREAARKPFEQVPAEDTHRERTGQVYSGGIVLSYGAPTSGDRPWGFAAEVGMTGGSRKISAHHSDAHPGAPARSFAPYIQTTFIVQLPLDPTIRPYAALSGRHVFDDFGLSSQTLTLALGVAWELF